MTLSLAHSNPSSLYPFHKGREAQTPAFKPCIPRGFANRGVPMRRNATRLRGETLARGKRLSPVFSSPREAAHAFQPVIRHLSVGELAFSTNKETAKCWKAARAFPSGVNLIALMAQFPCVRTWVNEQVEAMGAHPCDPKLINEIDRRIAAYMQRKE